MKLALIIIGCISLLAFTLFYFTTDRSLNPPADMPWHVTVHDPNHTEVFGIVLNQTTLEQARQQFGQLDGLALYQNERGDYSLEAYFGKLTIGPFSARLIANLDASQDELEKLTEHTIKRIRLESGSIKWTLKPEKQLEQGQRKIRALSYIPDYAGLDQDFIRARFGEPASRQSLDETTQLWLYPQLGVRIMLDNDGRELFEYVAPAQFKTPDGAG